MKMSNKILIISIVAIGLSIPTLVISIGTAIEMVSNMNVVNQNFKMIEEALNDLYTKHPEPEGVLENVKI